MQNALSSFLTNLTPLCSQDSEDEDEDAQEDDDDEEWECEETEIESANSTTINVSDYYNVTECASILALNSTEDLNSTYADLTAWCANATAAATPAPVEPTVSASETLFNDASSSFVSATDLPTGSASAWSSETVTDAPSATASATSSLESSQSEESTDAITSYVDVYATSYVEPSAASATQSSSSVESESTGTESLSKRLSRGFKKVRRAHVGRNAFV